MTPTENTSNYCQCPAGRVEILNTTTGRSTCLHCEREIQDPWSVHSQSQDLSESMFRDFMAGRRAWRQAHVDASPLDLMFSANRKIDILTGEHRPNNLHRKSWQDQIRDMKKFGYLCNFNEHTATRTHYVDPIGIQGMDAAHQADVDHHRRSLELEKKLMFSSMGVPEQYHGRDELHGVTAKDFEDAKPKLRNFNPNIPIIRGTSGEKSWNQESFERILDESFKAAEVKKKSKIVLNYEQWMVITMLVISIALAIVLYLMENK